MTSQMAREAREAPSVVRQLRRRIAMETALKRKEVRAIQTEAAALEARSAPGASTAARQQGHAHPLIRQVQQTAQKRHSRLTEYGMPA
jgi:hypothetical protein